MNVLFRGPLTGSFKASSQLLIVANTVTLDFQLVTSNGPTTLQWYMEFFDQDLQQWCREISEEDTGSGVVTMAVVVRTFRENGGAALADGSHLFSSQFIRRAQLVRVQMRVTAGAAQVTLAAPFGEIPVS